MPFFHGIEMLGMLSMRRRSSSDREVTRDKVNRDEAEKVAEKFIACVRSTSMEHPFTKCHLCGTKYTRAFEPVHHSCGSVSCSTCVQGPPRDNNADEMVKYSVQRFNYHLQNYRSNNLSIASEKEKLLEELEEQHTNQYANDLERMQGLGENTTRPEMNAMGMVFNQLADLIRMQADYVAHCTPPLLQGITGSTEVSAATTDLLKSLHDCSIQMRQARESYRKITEMHCRRSPMISRSELCSSRLPSSIACCCVQSIEPIPQVEDTEKFLVLSTSASCSHEEAPFWDFEIQTPDESVVTAVVETQVPTGDDELKTPSTSSGSPDEALSSDSGTPVLDKPVFTPLDKTLIPATHDEANMQKLSKTPNDVKKRKHAVRIRTRVVNRLIAHFEKFHLFDDSVNVSDRIPLVGVRGIPSSDLQASLSNRMSLESIAEDPMNEVLDDRTLVDNVYNVPLAEDDEQKNVLQEGTHTQTPEKDVDVSESSAPDEAVEKKPTPRVRMMTPEQRAGILKDARQHDDKKPRSQHQVRSNCCGSEFSEK